MIISLDKLDLNKSGVVIKLLDSSLKERFIDLGIVPETPITCTLISPFNDPKAYLIKGTQIAIRNNDAQNILIRVGEDYA